jgi:hypothetical protein
MSHFRRLLPLLGAGWPTLVSPGVLSPLASFSRAQVGSLSSAVLADGATRVEFGADAPRRNGTSRRLLIEGQRTNSFRNPRCEGAVPGTPGTMPTFWSFAATLGLTTSVVGSGVEDGLGYVDVRFFGTPTGSGTLQVNHDAATTGISDGQVWTYSLFSRLVGGSLTNVGAAAMVATAGTGNVVTNYTIQSSRLGVNRTTCTVTAAGGATNVIGRLRFPVTVNLPVDATIRVGSVQLEQGPAASTPILPPVGTPGASTRGVDVAAAPLASLGIGDNGACTIIGTFMLPQMAPASAQQVLVQIDGGSETQRIFLRNGAGANSLVLGRVGGGSTTIAVGSLSAGQIFRCGFSVDGAGRVAASLNGAAPVEVTGALTSGFTTLRLGDSAAAMASMFGEVGTVPFLPRPVSDAELQARVAALPL